MNFHCDYVQRTKKSFNEVSVQFYIVFLYRAAHSRSIDIQKLLLSFSYDLYTSTYHFSSDCENTTSICDIKSKSYSDTLTASLKI